MDHVVDTAVVIDVEIVVTVVPGVFPRTYGTRVTPRTDHFDTGRSGCRGVRPALHQRNHSGAKLFVTSEYRSHGEIRRSPSFSFDGVLHRIAFMRKIAPHREFAI